MNPRRIFTLFAISIILAQGVSVPFASAELIYRPDIDTDGDLIPDWWENDWAFNANDPQDADQDADGDRLSNRDEFHANTHPREYTAISAMSDRQIQDMFKGMALLYFWEQSRAPYYWTPDNANYNNADQYSNGFNSIASTGFALTSYVMADELGWVPSDKAYKRIETLLTHAVEMQDPQYDTIGVPLDQQANRHGYLYHFVDDNGKKYSEGTEISTVDHALFLLGVLTAGEYYTGTRVEILAHELFLNTDWDWLYDGQFLIQGWFEDATGSLDGGRPDDAWNRYSELLGLIFLALGHPDEDKGIGPEAWDALSFGTQISFPNEYAHVFPDLGAKSYGFVPNMPNTLNVAGYQNDADEMHVIFAGSLHNHQYSHMFSDFRMRPDGRGTDYFANSITNTLVNRQYCMNLNLFAYGGFSGSPNPLLVQPYEGFNSDSWGLMAGLTSFGYAIMQPIIKDGEDFSVRHLAQLSDSGTVMLNAALGSTAFTPRESTRFARNYLTHFQDNTAGFNDLIGRYGFRNAVNMGLAYNNDAAANPNEGQLGHFPGETISLDLGPVAGNIENHQTGLLWKYAMRSEYLRNGMQVAGFNLNPVAPYILNFDSNPPQPHQDPNGGGVDPNSFGGNSYAFGNASVSYEAINDPFPQQDFGPQGWVQRIEAQDNQNTGVFITLNNHSISRWGSVSFWVRGEAGGESYDVGLKDSVVDYVGGFLTPTEVKLPIAEFHPQGQITTEWTEVRIPLREFSGRYMRTTSMDNISFTATASNGGTIYIDDIAFLPDEFKPAPVANVQGTLNASNVMVLSWDQNEETDVVGYRIYRSDQGGNHTLQNAELVTQPPFTDSSPVGQGQTASFYVTAVDRAEFPNESDPSQTIIVNVGADTTPPQIVINNPSAGATVFATGFTYSGTIADASGVASISVYVYDYGRKTYTVLNAVPDYDSGSGVWSFSVLPEHISAGSNATFWIGATDGAGNRSGWVQRIVSVVAPPSNDSTAPVITLSSPTEGASIPASGFTYTGTLSDASDIAEVWVYVYDFGRKNYTVLKVAPSYNSGTGVWSFDVLPEHVSAGSKAVFWISATDVHGNRSGWLQRVVNAEAAPGDAVAPVVTVNTPLEGASIPASGFTFSGTITDVSDIASTWVYVYDYGRQEYTVLKIAPNYNSSTGAWSFQLLPEHMTAGSSVVFWVNATDVAGNRSGWVQRIVQVVP